MRPLLALGVALCASAAFGAAAPQRATTRGAQREAPATVQVRVLDLPSLRRAFDALALKRASLGEGARTAAWADFATLADAVLGETASGRPLDFRVLQEAEAAGQTWRAPAAAGVAARDNTAYQLQQLGYSAREIADVVSGRITRAALDNAQKMLMLGLGREAAANYLDTQYRRASATLAVPGAPATRARRGAAAFDAAVAANARANRVDPALVRAIIAVESAWDPAARSRAGAIGLMQLMPATARELGVDPWNPEENIAGGVRYLAGLLSMFDGVELALVAYNGGPGLARRYAQGQVALYGETREYVTQVLARLRAPARRQRFAARDAGRA
jgi:soluble lytic murein transglycosylase-like protein